MSTISGLNSYANAYSLYGQIQNLSDGTEKQSYGSVSNSGSARITNLLASRSNQNQTSSSLTSQLSSLVRLTRYAMDAMGLDSDSKVTFSRLQEYCDQVQENFTKGVREGLEKAVVDLSNTNFTLNPNGTVQAHSSSGVSESLAQLALDDATDEVLSLKASLIASGVDLSKSVSFSMASDGTISLLGSDILVATKASALARKLLGQGIDPDIDFSLATNEDDSVSVNCGDSRYTKVLQAFFDENPSIVADYQRTEVLAGIEDARKFLSLSPSDMRTRLQLESLSTWWFSSDSTAGNFFGAYSGGIFSRLSGINVSV